MQSISFRDRTLYRYDSGLTPDTKATVLLLHGLGSSSSYYFPVIPYLPHIRCIAIDTSGSGLSELGADEQNIESIVQDVVAQLDAAGAERVIVVGHSMGGIVASQLAESYAARVYGVVLIGPVDPSAAMASIFEERVTVVQRDGLAPLAATVPKAATGSFSTPLHHAFVRALILGTSPAGYASLCRVIATAPRPNYAAITKPLLVIAGADDKTAPMAGCEAILNAYSTPKESKSLMVLEGVGHWHCVEAGEEVAKHIRDFVERIPVA